MLSSRERKRKQHEKELKSLRNKMGINIVWFDSLSNQRKFDLLIEWKRFKYTNDRQKPEWIEVWKKVPIDPKRPWGRTKRIRVKKLIYPASLKHFIKEIKTNYRFIPRKNKVREATIDLLLKK